MYVSDNYSTVAVLANCKFVKVLVRMFVIFFCRSKPFPNTYITTSQLHPRNLVIRTIEVVCGYWHCIIYCKKPCRTYVHFHCWHNYFMQIKAQRDKSQLNLIRRVFNRWKNYGQWESALYKVPLWFHGDFLLSAIIRSRLPDFSCSVCNRLFTNPSSHRNYQNSNIPFDTYIHTNNICDGKD